jgi:hypothetical protein
MNEMMQMFGQMMTMPMQMMDCWMKSMQGMQSGWSSCMPAQADCYLPPVCEPVQEAREEWREHHDDGPCCGIGCQCGGRDCRDDCPCRCGPYHTGSDREKLIEYTLVSLAPGHGRVLHYGQTLVDGCTSMEEVENEIIVGYVNEHCGKVNGKNLRVYMRALDSWCKPSWDYEERQIAVLEQIAHKLG